MTSTNLANEAAVTGEGAFQPFRRRRRLQDRVGESLLTRNRKPDDFRFLDGAVGGFLSGAHDKVADAAPLNFSGALDEGEHIGRETRLDAGRAGGLLRHHIILASKKPFPRAIG